MNNICTIAQRVNVTGQGSNVSYRFTGLPTGSYVIFAWKDVNKNEYQDAGDYEGVYANATPVPSPATSINFNVWENSSSPNALRVGGE